MTTSFSAPSRSRVDAASAATSPQSKSHLSTAKRKDERINLRVNERLISILADLKEQKGMTMSESIRKGIGLLHIAMTEQSKGRRLAFIDEQGNVVAEVHAI